MQIIEREAYVYWKTAQRFRLKQREGASVQDESDDLDCIAYHTFNATIRKDCLRMLGQKEAQFCAS